jgi:DNA-binding PucR family transcriptional regulator
VEETAVGTAPAVRTLAAELLPRSHELARAMTDHLAAAIPEIAASEDLALREQLRASAEANIGQVLRLLRLGVGVDAIVVPPEAAEFMRDFVRRGIALPVLLRSYRLGHAWLWDRLSRALQERIVDPDELVTAQEQASAFMFAYVDRISDELVAEYGSERERLMRGAMQMRADTVRAILAGETLGAETITRRLGYEVRRHHVGMRLSSSTGDVLELEEAAREAAAALGPGAPLIVPAGATSLDAWWGSYEPVPADTFEQYQPPEGILVALGTPRDGIVGFKRTHLEALQAARVAWIAGTAGSAVTTYARVELVSLLANDLPRARAFVGRQLGPLAAPSEAAQRLRETVLAFLLAGGSGLRAAKELYVHQNTVTYRVKRAEELLGRRVTDRPLELSCALRLAAALGPAVLASEDGGEAT